MFNVFGGYNATAVDCKQLFTMPDLTLNGTLALGIQLPKPSCKEIKHDCSYCQWTYLSYGRKRWHSFTWRNKEYYLLRTTNPDGNITNGWIHFSSGITTNRIICRIKWQYLLHSGKDNTDATLSDIFLRSS